MEYWSNEFDRGVGLTHHSTTPTLHYSNLLLLVERNFRQRRRLDHAFLFFFFLGLVERRPGGGNEPRGNENHKVTLDMLVDIGAEEPADDRNIPNDWGFIFRFLHVFAHQSAEHDGLSV